MRRDFRLHVPRESLPLVFADFLKWQRENPKVLEVVEWTHNVLDAKNGISIRTAMRILKKYSGVNLTTQKKTIETLVTNDKFVRAEIKFKIKDSKIEIDIDDTLLYLNTKPTSKQPREICYQ